MVDCRTLLYMSLVILYSMCIFSARGTCPPKWEESHMGNCYKILERRKTYQQQENKCMTEKGGHLASIHSKDELDAIISLPRLSAGSYFIGLTRNSTKDDWEYSDGTRFEYVYWKSGEPNDTGNKRICVVMKDDGGWESAGCLKRYYGVCKQAKICDPPGISSATLMINGEAERYENGSTIEYYCADGYSLIGQSRATCRNGNWNPSSLPRCKGERDISSDKTKTWDLPNIQSTILKINHTVEPNEKGSIIEYYCADGFSLKGNSNATCDNGKWIPSGLPECEAKPCGSPNIQKTTLKVSGTDECFKNGSTVECNCTGGCTVKKRCYAVCYMGKWTLSTHSKCGGSLKEGRPAGGLSFVIGIVCLLVVAVIICTLMYKQRKVSQSHQYVQRRCRTNEDLHVLSIPHANASKSIGNFPLDKIKLLEQVGTGLFGPIFKATSEGLLDQDSNITTQVTFLEGSMAEHFVYVPTQPVLGKDFSMLGSTYFQALPLYLPADNSTEEDKMKFRLFVEVYRSMKQHPNVVRLFGHNIETDPMFFISEYLTGGNLKQLLERESQVSDSYENVNQRFPNGHLLKFAHQIVLGMEYITSRNCVHMDLMTSKILLSRNLVCKLSDFRPVESLARSNFYGISMKDNPSMRWMAPETLRSNSLSNKSNVWSFGVVLWEIMTSGSTPYRDMSNEEVLEFITAGCKLPRPCQRGTDMYATMMKCWAIAPADRPEFWQLRLEVEKALDHFDEYDAIVEEPEYENAMILKRYYRRIENIYTEQL